MHSHTQHHTQHNTQHRTETETERETEQEDRDRERQSKKTETEREEKTKEKKTREKREDMSSTIHLSFLSAHLGRSTVLNFCGLPILCGCSFQILFFELFTHAVTVSIFPELFSYAATVFFLPELILHKYSVGGYSGIRLEMGRKFIINDENPT